MKYEIVEDVLKDQPYEHKKGWTTIDDQIKKNWWFFTTSLWI